MKSLCTFLAILICFSAENILAQVPQAIPYQAVARDLAGSLLAGQPVSLRFSIHDATTGGTIVYQETQSVTTNSLGLFTVNIGLGIPIAGIFSAIDWGTNAKFMQVEMDANGGILYIDMGTQQILSVPYSLYSETSKSSSSVSGTTNFVSRFTGVNTVGNSSIFDDGTNIGIGNSSPSALFSVGPLSQFQINSSGAIGAATGIISSGPIQFSGLNSNGIVRTIGGTGHLSSSGGAINLATEVTGILSVANGGTGSSSQNFLDLSSNQFVGGLKTFTNIPTGTNVGEGTIYINPANNGGSASNTLMGLAIGGIEKFIVDASGNIKTSSLAGVGNRMVQTDANGVLMPLASGTASQVLLGTGVWGNIPTTTVWSLTGNAGTASGTNFLGTTDSQPLIFKVNSQKAGYIDSVSKVSAFGYQALNSSIGEYNTSLGYYALKENTTADFNTAVGSTSLQNNTTGTENTAIGTAALRQNIIGVGNTAAGSFALLSNNGNYNTAVGGNAFSLIISGNENTAIGYNANVGAFAINNATAVGANAIVSQSNSLVLGNLANVGIGTSTPNFKLEVTDEASFNGIEVGKGGNAIVDNTALGSFALDQNNTGAGNTAVGYNSIHRNNTGSNNTATGVDVLSNNVIGSNNTAMGFESQLWNGGSDNTSVGYHALLTNSAGGGNTAIGLSSLNDNTNGGNNVAIGNSSMFSNLIGSENTAIGHASLNNNIGGTFNTALGSGANVLNPAIPLTNATAIGAGAIVAQSNSLVLGNNANVGIGISAPSFKLEVSEDASINGVEVGKGGGSINDNTALGTFVLDQNNAGVGNTAIGHSALRQNSTGSNNTATGVNALLNNITGENNTAIGFESLSLNNGIDNTSVGFRALQTNELGNGNTAIGLRSLNVNTNGNNNVAIGINAMKSNIGGNENTAIGNGALIGNIFGTNNTAIGSGANVSSVLALTNATAIGAGALALQSNSLILGNSADVGIGTSNPTAKLEVVGDVKVSSTITSSVLAFPGIVTNNSSGLLGTTAIVPVENGGTGTSSLFNPGSIVFAGIGGVYLEDAALYFNQSNSSLGIGTSNPQYKLDVNGDIRNGEHLIFNSGNAVVDIGPNAKLFFRKNAVQGNPGISTELAVLTDNGDWGLGIAAPLAKLHVMGNGLFTGNVSAFKGSFSGDVSANNANFSGNVTAACGMLVCSDVRYKKHITPLAGSLEKLSLLKGVNYYFKKEEFPELNFNNDKQIGLIAQEVEVVFPELVKTDTKGFKSVDYAKLTPLLVEAIKELKALNEDLKEENAQVKNSLGVLQTQTQERFITLEAKINLLLSECVTTSNK